MKLSEAMMLGDSLRKRDPWAWITTVEGGSCGCAMGGAALAVGSSHRELLDFIGGTMAYFHQWWPWLTLEIRREIGDKFLDVCEGKMTFEALVDYVRSIEPDCGECNQFQCTCQKQEAAQEQIAVTV